jgi:hypothetical protein
MAANGWQASLRQVGPLRAAVQWRGADALPEVRLSAGGHSLRPAEARTFPQAGQKVQWLLLVDTSDPRREATLRRAASWLEEMVAAAPEHHHFGLARFDAGLSLLAPLNASRERVRERLGELHAGGRVTELYRSVLEGIRLLEREPAARKALLLVSDGLAEDRAYFHRDVETAAQLAGISLYGVGVAERVGETVALQVLRRLSEDSGGVYLEAAPGHMPSREEGGRLLAAADGGGELEFDLAPLAAAGLGGAQLAELEIMPVGGAIWRQAVNLQLPPLVVQSSQTAARQEQQLPAKPPAVHRPPPAVPSADPAVETDVPGWWLWAPLLLISAYGLWWWLRRRAAMTAKPVAEPPAPYAWLEWLGGGRDGHRYPLLRAVTRLGRYRDNDLVLDDPAASRYHAEIVHGRDGSFILSDLGSRNGLMINQQEMRERRLEDGDIIEIGDSRLRFIAASGAADEADTALFRTQMPQHRPAG